MAYPKITWNDGINPPGTVLFQLPPTSKPFKSLTATRTDVYSTAGVKQSVWLRTDRLMPILMNYVQVGDDIAAFDAFMEWALEGGQFNWFPDADIDNSFLYTLEDTTWKPEFAILQYYKFTLNFRKVVLG
jgi:hypothetical protein